MRAWRAGDEGFREWPPVVRADGSEVWQSAVLGLDLRVEGPLLRFDHPERGPLPLRREVLARWRAAEQAREAERRAREAAEQRALAAERALAALQEDLRRRERGP